MSVGRMLSGAAKSLLSTRAGTAAVAGASGALGVHLGVKLNAASFRKKSPEEKAKIRKKIRERLAKMKPEDRTKAIKRLRANGYLD